MNYYLFDDSLEKEEEVKPRVSGFQEAASDGVIPSGCRLEPWLCSLPAL